MLCTSHGRVAPSSARRRFSAELRAGDPCNGNGTSSSASAAAAAA